MNKKYLFYIIISIFVIIAGGLFLSYPLILKYFVENKIRSVKNLKYKALVVNYSGNIILTDINIENTYIVVNIDSLVLLPNYKDFLLNNKITFKTIKVSEAIIVENNRQGKVGKTKTDTTVTFLEKANRNYQKFKKLIQLLPEKLILKNIVIKLPGKNLKIKKLITNQNKLRGQAIFNNDTLNLLLRLNPEKQQYEFQLDFDNNLSLQLNDKKDSLKLKKIYIKIKEDEEQTYIKSNFYNLYIEHRRLAEAPTILDSLGFAGTIAVSKNKLNINGPAHFFFNDFDLYGSLLYKITDKDSTLIFKVRTDTFHAQHGLEQIPTSFRNYIQGMKLQGNIAFNAKILVQLGEKDKADIVVKPFLKNFRIIEYGKSDLRKLNEEFKHRPYKSNRVIIVGPDNPYFTPYDEISSYLIDAVLTSEDGGFFKHKGFNVKALKQSLITNLRKGRFVRGGSTITMQLIKNVFLSHKKTLSRKFQEILLTWLLEHFRIVPKKRMLEVYLNIIEWGPNVYGIGEAAEFYFKRKPKDLPPNEAIFLAMIIPRPRKFYYYFDENDKLKPKVEYYYEKVGKFMVKHGVLEEWQYKKLLPPTVWIIGEARKYLPLYKKYHKD